MIVLNGVVMIRHSKDDSYEWGLTSIPKSFEETMAEEYNVQKVINYLEGHGIIVKTQYGYYRPTYDILKDIGERWEQLKI